MPRRRFLLLPFYEVLQCVRHTHRHKQSNTQGIHVCGCRCLCVCLLLNSRTTRSATLKIGFRMPAVRFITASNINSNNNSSEITAKATTTTRNRDRDSNKQQTASRQKRFRHGLNFLMSDSRIRAKKCR